MWHQICAAILLALRLDARYISVLGVIGGFLTPYLLSTGVDNPPGLFGYMLILDLGLLAVALKKRLDFLVPLAVAGTLALEIGWTLKFFTDEKALTGVVAWLLFGALFLGARPGLVLGFLTVLLLGVSVLSLLQEGFESVFAAATGLAFTVLLYWTTAALTPDLLPWGLAFYLLFAILTAAFPLLLPRVRPDAIRAPWLGFLPLAALLLFTMPVVQHLTGFVIWPFLLLAALLLQYEKQTPGPLMGWVLVFVAVHLAFPLAFASAFSSRVVPWATAALAGPLLFWPMYRSAFEIYGKAAIGLLPAALALAYLAALVVLIKAVPAEEPARLAQKTWLGGATLFFVTLIFPLQFSKEWITIGWALEGAALVWLFRRVPHRGLIFWATGLLAASFVRLALNPAVVTYHERAASHLLPRNVAVRFQRIELRGALRGLGTVLLFLLVNIEIADYFSTGSTLTFRFTGSFALDVAYSLAWGAFALVLLLVGIRTGHKAARLSSLALFAATIGKVFLHDLWRLGQLYRVGSIFVLAVLLILVSFLYQKFIAPERGGGRRVEPVAPGEDAEAKEGEE